MKQSEAKEQIFSIWFSQSDKCNNSIGYPFTFYGYIQNNYPNLLRFKCSEDYYQLIKAWVYEWQKNHC